MKLMTKEIENRIQNLGESEELGEEAQVHVKFFSPWSGWSWYATEYDPEEGRFFGYVNGDYPEYGYFSLNELSGVEVMPGVPAVERDKHWNHNTTIGEVVKTIQSGGYL